MRKILSIFVLVTVVLFAVACKKTTFNVTFESNGGSAVLPAVVEENKLLEEPDAPTKTGFTFDGWYKESALTNEWNFAGDLVTEDITLYAKWMATDAHLVDLAYDWLTLGDLSALTNQSARIIFPTTKDGVTISWDIDKDEYIAANGLISQPTHEEGTQTVTLTATLTKGSATREKEFTATVLALPNPEDAEPLIYETFEDYTDGNILGQDGPWGPVSGKSGNSLFTVVSTLTLMIPDGSKALKIEALKELQIEAPIVHDYDLVVIEVDLLQTTTSNGSAVNIQSSSSSPVIGFGLDGASLFYRTDNGDLMKTPIDINTWYTLRVEVDLVNKTIEAFYYEDGQLVPMTPDKVTYIGALSLQSIFIRSGSSTTEVLREPAYVTNLVVNRIEALPRPVEGVKLGEVTDISSTVSVEVGTSFTPDVPKVYNYYGSQGLLVKDTDYTLVISNPVDIETPDIYTVTYTITNKDDNTDVVVINQSVTVYAPSTPNEITNATSTVALYEEKLSTITVTVVQPEGTLYYLLSNNATETKEAIILGEQKTIDSVTVTLTDLDVGEFIYIHFYVELNGDSNILSHEINRQEVVEIATPQAFYDAIHLSESNQKPKYFLITADIDFTDYTWVVLSTTKLWTTLNGDNHTLSNLSIDRNVKGGIFSDAEDAIIKNLILDHIDVTSSVGVSTVLVGETRGNVLIENVVMMNSSIEITDTSGGSDYAALFVGRVRGGSLTIKHISAIDSSVLNHSEYTGGIVAGQDTTRPVFMSDIYMNNVTVQEDSTSGQMVGGVIGRVQAEFVLERFVGINIDLIGIKNVGGIVGKFDDGISSIITDVYLEGEVSTFDPETLTKGSVGGLADVTPTLTNIWVSGFANIGATGVSVEAPYVIDQDDVKSEAWWTTNINSIATSNLWGLDEHNIFALNHYLVLLKPLIEVTIVYNFDIDGEIIQIRQDEVFDHEAPIIAGYTFVGWYSDSALETSYEENPVIVAPLTIYGKYEVVPASPVSFVTGVDGLSVPTQDINYGESATEPSLDDQMIEGVLKELTGWTLNGELFSFASPITEAIELVAVWETVEFTVTFDGDNPVLVPYGELVSEPVDVPTHYFSEVTFKEWQLSGTAYDFNQPVISDLSLVSAYNEPVSISIDTVEEFYHMATVESTYNYVLSTNLDFTGYVWNYVNTSFKGNLDGQGYTVSNIQMLGLTGYAGIFPRANGATIRNLVVDGITIQTTARAGVLIGRVENGDTLIENVVVKNSSVEGSDSNGVGGLIGHVSRKTEVYNVAVINTTVSNVDDPNVGGLVGRVDSAPLFADDILISNVQVTTTTTKDSDAGASAFVGYVRDNENSLVSAMRIIILDTTVSGNRSGAFIGYNRFPGTSTVADAYFEVTFTNNIASSLIGYDRDQEVVLDQSTIFGHFTGAVLDSKTLALTNDAVPTDAAWWTNNLNNIATSDAWIINTDGSVTLALIAE